MFLFSTVLSVTLAHLVSYPMGVWDFFSGNSGCDMKQTTHLNLVLTLEMHGVIPPLTHVFMVWCLLKYWGNFTFTKQTNHELYLYL
jgi:hypothetical protein